MSYAFRRNDVPPGAFGNGCRGKRGYSSKRLADGARRVSMRRYGESGETLQTYKCRACGKWHIGRGRRRQG